VITKKLGIKLEGEGNETMTLAIGYKRIRYGSNEGAMLDEEIVEFCNIMSM
tara:strand:- start:124 stop:276 length:153 start_codon:yes stop_codon:yes gene_type:complete